MHIIFPDVPDHANEISQKVPPHAGHRRHTDASAQANTMPAGALVEKNRQMIGHAKNGQEKARTLFDIQNTAESVDVQTLQNYMTVMSHTMSEEDYARMEKEGFSFRNLDPEEAVTIVDKIKAELLRAGEHIAGYTDDLDVDTVAQALGSQTLAENLCREFAAADLPIREQTLAEIGKAWEMTTHLTAPDVGSYSYLIENALEPEIRNLYLAQNSGAGQTAPGRPDYYAEEIAGYYSQSADDTADITPTELGQLLKQAGVEETEGNLRTASRLLEAQLPVTQETIAKYRQIEEIAFPVPEEHFAKAVANALSEGRLPVRADLSERQNLYERAHRLLERYSQVQEVRLHMTAEVNVTLLKSGFAIDTAPIEEMIEAVKQAKKELAQRYFPQDTPAQALEKYQLWQEVDEVTKDLPALPVQTLGMGLEESVAAEDMQGEEQRAMQAPAASVPMADFYAEGVRRRQEYEQAAVRYETLGSSPRADLGDSIRKAFANVDDILEDLGLETTAENRRAVRILGYNRMEIRPQTIALIRQADEAVQEVLQKMTPASVLKMIRDGVNPLEKSFAELNTYFDALPREYADNAEKYSRFLYSLEQKKELTAEERESFIGIYRLMHQIEKSDGAVIGALVNTGAQLQFQNLLSAVRSGKVKGIDVKVADEMGIVTERIAQGESISDQIMKGFYHNTQEVLSKIAQEDESAERYRREELAQLKETEKTLEQDGQVLEKAQMPKTAENLLAAGMLREPSAQMFRPLPGRDRQRILEHVWEKLGEKETFAQEYTEALEQAKALVEDATVAEAEQSLEVKQLRLLHKQLTIAGALSHAEEYVFPMALGEEVAKIHLTIEQGKGEKGLVEITADFSDAEPIRASLRMTGEGIDGLLQATSADEVNKLQQVSDIFCEYIKEDPSFCMDAQMSVVTVHTARQVSYVPAARNTDRAVPLQNPQEASQTKQDMPDNARLYQVAKLFLQAASKALESKAPASEEM